MARRFYQVAAAVVLLGLPAGVRAQGHEIVVPPTLRGTLICATGDTLLMSGQETLGTFLMSVLTADRQMVPGQQHNYDPNFPHYAFRWLAAAAGIHRLSLDYILENHTTVTDHRLVVQVQDSPPIVLNPLPAQFFGAAAGKDLPVTVQVTPDFHTVKVDFFLDGADVGSATAAPFAFSLPLGGVLTGPHRAFIQATDPSGETYISPVQTVMVASGNAPGSASNGSGGGSLSHTAQSGSEAHSASKGKRGAGKGKARKRASAEQAAHSA